jgi:hypothetical protein
MVINDPTGSTYAARFGQAVSGSIHDTEFFVNRCLVNTNAPLHYAYPTLVSVKDGKYNTHTLKIFDSVIAGPPSGSTRFLDDYYFAQGGGSVFKSLGNSNIHIKGSTLYNKTVGRGNFTSQTSNNTIKVEGTLWGLWNPDSTTIFYLNNFVDSFTIKDTLISNSSSTESGLTGDITNLGYDTDFYFDNQPHSGAVTFNSSSSDGESNFRLLADLDNLAVKYMTSGELSYKDITGYKRPEGTDQRDAGAFQSISDQITVRNIGTSSADFTPDYATLNLWLTGYYDNANVLNGETHVMRLKSGESHPFSLQARMDDQANVNQSFIFSGHKPHGGVWASGPILNDQSYFWPRTDANSFGVKFKDIVISGTTSGTASVAALVQRLTNNAVYEQGNAAPEQNYEFENCLIRYQTGQSYGSNQSPRLVYGVNKGYLTDSDGNIVERGVSNYKYKNSLFIAENPRTDVYGGFLLLGGEFASSKAKSNFLAEGCTFINCVFENKRQLDDRFQMSVRFRRRTILPYARPAKS